MGVLRFWFVTAPSWGWHDVAHEGHGFAGLVVLAVLAVLYAAVTLAVVAGIVRVLVVLGRRFAAGFRRGWAKS